MRKILNFIKKHGFNIISGFVLLFSLTYAVFFTTNAVNGSSMQPNYASGDLVITRKDKEHIAIGDVVTVNGKVMTQATGMKSPNMIKRVVAEPGDKVDITNNRLYVNDELIEEKYISEEMYDTPNISYELADDEFFVLGDNRNHSTDSRDYGPVKRDWINGRAILTIYSPDGK